MPTRPRRRGLEAHAIGRSRGGLTTQPHAAADAFGRPIRVTITPGHWADSPQAKLRQAAFLRLRPRCLSARSGLAGRKTATREIASSPGPEGLHAAHRIALQRHRLKGPDAPRPPRAAPPYQWPILPMLAQGSCGASDSPSCSNSIEMLSGLRTKAMWPSRGGRLMVTPASISFWHIS